MCMWNVGYLNLRLALLGRNAATVASCVSTQGPSSNWMQ